MPLASSPLSPRDSSLAHARRSGCQRAVTVTSGELQISGTSINGGAYQQFNTGGAGNIVTVTGYWRSAATTAAYLAAEASAPVTMAVVIAAVQREYRKLGRLVREKAFGRYLDLVGD